MRARHVTRFQAAYVSEQEIRQIVSHMNAGRRQGRRWLAEDQINLNTGTDGRIVTEVGAKTQPKRRGMGLMLGHQLRLIK